MILNKRVKHMRLAQAAAVFAVLGFLASCGSGLQPSANSTVGNGTAQSSHYFAVLAATGDNKVFSYAMGSDGTLGSQVNNITVTNAAQVVTDSTGACGFALTTDGKVQPFSIGTTGSLTAVGALTAALTAVPGKIIVNPSNTIVYVSSRTDKKIFKAALTLSTCALAAFDAGTALTVAGPIDFYPNGMEFASATKLFVAGSEDGSNAGGAGVGAFSVDGVGAITGLATTFIATTNSTTDIPSLIALDSGLTRAYVLNQNGTAANGINQYTTTATTVTATAQGAGYQTDGTTCTGFALNPARTAGVALCSAVNKKLTSYSVSAGLVKQLTVTIASLASGGKVAFAPTTSSNIVLVTDNVGGGTGKLLTYTMDGTGAFTAVNSVSTFTNPAGVVAVAKTY